MRGLLAFLFSLGYIHRVENITYGRQSIDQSDIDQVVEVLKSDWLTQGPMVSQFENALAEFVQAKHVFACSNGTAALHLTSLALGLKKGDNVLCTSMSFAATSNAILYSGADVEFVDIDPETFNIDLNLLEEKLASGNYKAVYATSFAGLPLDAEKISNLCRQHNAFFVEDCCHAIGGHFHNLNDEKIMAGSSHYSDMSIFSFHPVKHIACGEGGAVSTNNDELAEKVKLYRSHGITKENIEDLEDQPWLNEQQVLGYNYRMSDILAGLGYSQLKKIKSNLDRRQVVAKTYKENLKLGYQKFDQRFYNAYHLFVVLSEKRKELYHFLREHKIFTQVHYIPIYKHPYYQKRYGDISLPKVEKYYEQCLSLPMFHGMTDEQLGFVIDKVNEFNK